MYLILSVPCVNGSVRLAGSPWSYQGRVEVCVNNTWGTICVNFWDANDTAVICRQLGFSSYGMSIILLYDIIPQCGLLLLFH